MSSKFFSDEMLQELDVAKKLGNGKYGYNLAGFNKDGNKTSISRKQKEKIFKYKNQWKTSTNIKHNSLVYSAVSIPSSMMSLTSMNQTIDKPSYQLAESSYQFKEPPKKKGKAEFLSNLQDEVVKTKLRTINKNPLLTFVKKDGHSQPKKMQRNYSIPNLYSQAGGKPLDLKSISKNLEKNERNKTRNKVHAKKGGDKGGFANKIIFEDFKNFENSYLIYRKQKEGTQPKSSTMILNYSNVDEKKVPQPQESRTKHDKKLSLNNAVYSTNVTRKKFITNPTLKTHTKSYSIHQDFFTKKNIVFPDQNIGKNGNNVFGSNPEDSPRKKSTNLANKLFKKTMSTTLLPGTKYIRYQMANPKVDKSKTISQNANSKSFKVLNSASKLKKQNVPKPVLKKSETHRILDFRNRQFNLSKKNSFIDSKESKQKTGNVNLRKKLLSKYAKNEASYGKMTMTSEKYLQDRQPKKIVKWKDYIQNLKIKS